MCMEFERVSSVSVNWASIFASSSPVVDFRGEKIGLDMDCVAWVWCILPIF